MHSFLGESGESDTEINNSTNGKLSMIRKVKKPNLTKLQTSISLGRRTPIMSTRIHSLPGTKLLSANTVLADLSIRNPKSGKILQNSSGRKIFSNHRERFRQQNVSGAFAELRRILPTHPIDKKLSKSEILKLSIKYIKLLQGVLKWQEENACES